MVTIKLRVNGANSTFYSKELYESDAILDMLRSIKATFGPCPFKIYDITGYIPPVIKEEKSYLERLNENKMFHINNKK